MRIGMFQQPNHRPGVPVHNLPVMAKYGRMTYLKDDDTDDADIDVEYLIDHLWRVGSPETVARRLAETYDTLGGFGTVIVNKYDFADTPEAYRHSLELFATEVIPAFAREGVERVT